jgi:23S rRNA pseudoU1915 N3-methylase RlmH
MAKGADVQKHKSADDISRMLLEGYTPDEVSKWLKQKYHHKMYWISGVTLTAYRNNFLNLTREQAWEKRKELLDTGDTQGVTQLDTFTAARGFIEAKQQATEEVISAITNFKSIQDKILERINLIDASTRDDAGNPVYKPKNEEILQGYLARLESMTTSFVKISQEMKKQQEKAGTTEIQITMSEINKYADVFKEIIQELLTRLDPSLLNEFLELYNEKIQKIMPATEGSVKDGNQVKISIKNSNNNVNITMNNNQSEQVPSQEQEQKLIIDTESQDIN